MRAQEEGIEGKADSRSCGKMGSNSHGSSSCFVQRVQSSANDYIRAKISNALI